MSDRPPCDLKKKLAPLAPVLDAASTGMVIIDATGTVVLFTQAARRLLGRGDHDQVGRPFKEVSPEAWPDMQKILAGGGPQIGRRLNIYAATIVANRNPIVLEGRVAGVISVFQDISHYEALISELRGYKELHRQLEAIFETSHDGLYIADGNAVTVRVNSAYEKITGLERGTLLGRNMHDLVQEKYFDHSVTLDVLKKGRSVTIMQNIKGSKQVMVTGTPVLDDEGKVALVVTNVRDMTSLNNLRGQLEQSRLLSSRYYQSLLEQEQYEAALIDMVVKSSAMELVLAKAVKVAAVDAAVLITGESGVGKTLLARTIHRMSNRRDRPMVKINCGAIPASLMESELFGYRKGAFTGADPAGKAGLLEAAHQGTVFLDEVAELTPAMQVKLLQVIEEGVFTRVGDTTPTEVDVRLIAATNRQLKQEVAAGRFRQDLFYRLNVVPIEIPPLRQRREDIPLLCKRCLEGLEKAQGLKKRLAPEVVDALMGYAFPGNVRELMNVLERMAIMSEGQTIGAADLPAELRQGAGGTLASGLGLKQAVEASEASIIQGALETHQTLTQAAKALGVHPTTLWRKMVKYGLREDAQLH
ncbi:MAG: sigma 54-interacting transcriptional regulator [Desulfarculaceae bacterium]|nr:sigma 54-interacting transcriptional regulator [Desulfarculaceae bacterium]